MCMYNSRVQIDDSATFLGDPAVPASTRLATNLANLVVKPLFH